MSCARTKRICCFVLDESSSGAWRSLPAMRYIQYKLRLCVCALCKKKVSHIIHGYMCKMWVIRFWSLLKLVRRVSARKNFAARAATVAFFHLSTRKMLRSQQQIPCTCRVIASGWGCIHPTTSLGLCSRRRRCVLVWMQPKSLGITLRRTREVLRGDLWLSPTEG